jgi:beta-glucosidase/6-phospho-beta-glucosidase/beta-galactosidase
MFHWDLPQALEKQFGGWRDRKVVHAFLLYADTLVKAFRSRIKNWITLNEVFFSPASPTPMDRKPRV